jgi:hypothetical protein
MSAEVKAETRVLAPDLRRPHRITGHPDDAVLFTDGKAFRPCPPSGRRFGRVETRAIVSPVVKWLFIRVTNNSTTNLGAAA